jgi:hypothetical protein
MSVGIAKNNREKCNLRFGSYWFVLLLLTVAMLGGCQADKPKADKAGSLQAAIDKHYAKAPIKLEMRLDRDRINSAQFFHLVLRVEGPENYKFELPDPEEEGTFGDLIVAGGNKSKPALSAQNIYQQQTYTLEPEGTGKVKLPPLHVSAWQNDKDKAKVIELVTDEIPLVVESLLDAGDEVKLADIAPPVPQPVNWLLWSAVGAGVVALLVLVWFLWRRRKPKAAPLPPAIPPYLVALRAIDNLRNKDLPAKGMTKQFYAELSDILRRYIEHHLGLRATEQTTEEFLAGLGSLAQAAFTLGSARHSSLRGDHKRLLRDFLTHCDLVKFAEYQPNFDDIDSALGLCQRFIEETGGGSAQNHQAGSAASDGIPAPNVLEFKQ